MTCYTRSKMLININDKTHDDQMTEIIDCCFIGFFGCSFFMVGIAKSFGILLQEMVLYFDVSLGDAAWVLAASGGIYTISG